MQLKNDTLLRALFRQPTSHTPVWMMRQAGRYLPEYRETRKKANGFMTMCQTPDLATQVTLQPIERYPLLDAAILFSDILTVPFAMGLDLKFIENEGPRFSNPLRTESDIQALSVPDMDKLSYVFQAAKQISSALNKRLPLIGFAGSPWTLATYMIEGQGGSDFLIIKKMAYERPELIHHLLSVLAETTTLYLSEQISAGADVVMLFDSWGGVLTSSAYKILSLSYAQRIFQGLAIKHPNTPKILFTKGGNLWLRDQAESGAEAIGVDWTISIGQAREQVGDKVALQGNLDPAILLTTPKIIQQEVKEICTSFGKHRGHIFNLGHGITQQTPPDNVQAMLEAIRHESTQL